MTFRKRISIPCLCMAVILCAMSIVNGEAAAGGLTSSTAMNVSLTGNTQESIYSIFADLELFRISFAAEAVDLILTGDLSDESGTEAVSYIIEETQESEFDGVVVTTVSSYLNIRAEANADSEVLGHLEAGGTGEIIEYSGDWIKITSGNVTGWVNGGYVVTGEDALAYVQENFDLVATSEVDGLRVRASASAEAKKLGTLSAGDTCVVVAEDIESEDGDGLTWVQVEYEGSTQAYICADYVTVAYDLTYAKTIEEIEEEEAAAAAAQAEAEAEANDGWVYLGTFEITAYCGCSKCTGSGNSKTALGTTPVEGRTVAVATSLIAFGSQIKIEGLDSIYIAEDTGGFASSDIYQIDLYFENHADALKWGVRYRDVWVKTN